MLTSYTIVQLILLNIFHEVSIAYFQQWAEDTSQETIVVFNGTEHHLDFKFFTNLYKKQSVHHNHYNFVRIHILPTQPTCGENEGFLLQRWDGFICIITFESYHLNLMH